MPSTLKLVLNLFVNARSLDSVSRCHGTMLLLAHLTRAIAPGKEAKGPQSSTIARVGHIM